MPTIVIATGNQGKLRELRELLRGAIPGLDVDTEVVSAAEVNAPDVPETGVSFAENSLLKARAVADATGLIAIADDSGLQVDVLGGAPGIFSARWAGHHGDDSANVNLLLAQLADIAPEHRGAHFSCAASLALPASRGEFTAVEHGYMPGTLRYEAAGEGGFGYDPIFESTELTAGIDGEPPAYNGEYAHLTNAEIPAEVKNAISHRARAFDALLPQIIEAVKLYRGE